MRRVVLAVLVGLLLVAFSPSLSAPIAHPARAAPSDWPDITVDLILQDPANLRGMIQVTAPPDGTDRLFAVRQHGVITVLEGYRVNPRPFLNIEHLVRSNDNEAGLLDLAFSPDFASDRTLFVSYTSPRNTLVIARYRTYDCDTARADPASAQIVLEIDQPSLRHNGGTLAFGTDGMLYIAVGDGGIGSVYARHAQDPSLLLGKILRVDVSDPAGGYTIPPSNPFVGRPGYAEEIWALGLRNPWGLTIDPVGGDLFITDVGEMMYEELNIQPGSSAGGENYGWPCFEAEFPYLDCNVVTPFVPPAAYYDHTLGCAIIGGERYWGNRYPSLKGLYFFSDWCTSRIWALRERPSGWQVALLDEETLDWGVTGFVRDHDGELVIVNQPQAALYRLSGLDPAPLAPTVTTPEPPGVLGATATYLSLTALQYSCAPNPNP